jgi:hypothetical protein
MPIRFFFSPRWLKLLPLAAALAVLAARPALAQEDNEPNELQKVFGAIGLLELPKDPIDYNERSPLVVPPSTELPKPGGGGDLRALNPEWPVDQDVKRKKEAAKVARKPIDKTTDAFYGGLRVNPNQLKGMGPTAKDTEVMSEREKTGSWRVLPSELGFKGWGQKTEMQFEKEPERTSLLQPPSGYQTPSANAPYGIVEEEKMQSSKPYDRNNDQQYKR